MVKDYTEKTIDTNLIYNGKIIEVSVDTVLLPNGKEAKREIVKHQGAVGILAITEENKLVFVKQFRKPLEQTIYELPAGKLEKDEDPKECALRELQEETGYTTNNIKEINKFYTSPGFANEIIYLFQAEDLQKGEAMPDEDEFVEVIELSLDEVNHLISMGEIIDAKTLVGIYYWQLEMLKEGS